MGPLNAFPLVRRTGHVRIGFFRSLVKFSAATHSSSMPASLVVVVEEEDGHGAGDLAGDEAEDDGEEGPAVAVA